MHKLFGKKNPDQPQQKAPEKPKMIMSTEDKIKFEKQKVELKA